MENWDQEKLETVVREKAHEEEKMNKNLKTQIVSVIYQIQNKQKTKTKKQKANEIITQQIKINKKNKKQKPKTNEIITKQYKTNKETYINKLKNNTNKQKNRYVSISWKQLNQRNTVGFGPVQMEERNVCINTSYHQVLF